jgi:glycyl-tRNA synthetase beta subunit
MDDVLVQALGKAKLWEMELMSGEVDLEEFCRNKRLTVKYVLKVLRLNALSPRIKTAIMNGTQPKTLALKDLLQKPFPLLLEEQNGMKIARWSKVNFSLIRPLSKLATIMVRDKELL